LCDIGGKALIDLKYNSSPSQLLAEVHPEYDWLPWRFEKCPRNYWDDMKNQRKFMDWASKQLDIKDMSDWYKLTYKVTQHYLGF
jgi:hypothetical protein